MTTGAAEARIEVGADRPIRAMLVDDSGVTRALMTRWLHDAGIEVVAVARNGEEARDIIVGADPDIVLLDNEMPKLGGLDVLPQLLAAVPGVNIVMASSLSRRGAKVTIEALRLGAADAIAKPLSGWAGSGANDFRAELVRKVKALGPRNDNDCAGNLAARQGRDVPDALPAAVCDAPVAEALAPAVGAAPEIVVIGSSTGGPNALFKMMSHLPKQLAAPILIAQHMPPTFTSIFADHLQRLSGIACAEAAHGEPLRAGQIYVAPGGRHLEVRRASAGATVLLSDEEPENFCRPSVNPLFRSAAAWGSRALGIVLTGMGSDGLDGARQLKARGGRIIVQDQATSVVWGMPGSVAREGLADGILPIGELGAHLARELAGR